MHPVLLEVPLPHWGIPLGLAFSLVAIAGAAVAVVGWRARTTDLLALGSGLGVAAGAAAWALRGDVYTVGSLPLSSYGVSVCVALVAGWYLTLGLGQRDGLPPKTTANCYVVAVISGLLLARFSDATFGWDEQSSWREMFDLRRGGLLAYGGCLGGAAAMFALLRIRGLPFLPWADVCAPSLALGISIGRVGSYLLGSAYGLPLGDQAPQWLRRLGTFPRWGEDVLQGAGAPAWIEQVSDGMLSFDSATSLPVHPTQLYEAVGAATILAAAVAIRQRQTFRGQVFLAFAFAFGCLRVCVDSLRGDPERIPIGPHFAQHHVAALALLGLGAAFVFGPSQSIRSRTVRSVARAACMLPAVLIPWLLRPEPYTTPPAVQLTVSQWLGMLTAVAAAACWGVLAGAARAHPGAAMAIELGPADGDDPNDRAESSDPDRHGCTGDSAEADDPRALRGDRSA